MDFRLYLPSGRGYNVIYIMRRSLYTLMKRILCMLFALALLCAMGACSKKEETPAQIITPAPTAEPTIETAEPTDEEPTTDTETAEPGGASELPGLSFYEAADTGTWLPLYRDFLSDSFDVIAALWPDGISGIGFIDLDLDGTPEMLLFDMGASAAMGVQFFDIVDGAVVCVSSVNEGAAAAFGGEHFSAVSVCAQLFEDFRLVSNGEQTFFTVHSANGTPESSWEEDIHFRRAQGDVLTLTSLCRCEIINDVENDTIAVENYSIEGEDCDEVAYIEAQQAVADAADLGYEAFGVFQWNDMERYDTSLEGLLVMLDDAAAGYKPILG